MGLIEKLKEANLDDGTRVVLRIEYGDDVVHAWDGYEDNLIADSDIPYEMATVATFPGDPLNVLYNMDMEGLMDDYEEEEEDDEDGLCLYVQEVLSEQGRAYGWIESETEQYDYKRGYCTVYAEFGTTVSHLFENMSDFDFGGWTAQVYTKLGTLKVDNY
tara:strand:+ start:362 stop:841 length:480 start_codon:yes stop_codon:yes gene_type:complete